MQTPLLTVVFVTALLAACTATAELPPGTAKATFVVHCYDVGVSALSGKPGVISVKRGWSGMREIDRVIYDPQRVTLAHLENWLKEADTYISTLEHSMTKEIVKEVSQ